ncbi:hypothetical protein TRIUR3_13621 [Triticum urartu]|uniref:Myb/SANT-like domain-containing protein n=1 Tax=Triticum urartu TaxID=4572 RepID=M7ZD31_TRIUA|nr:hypothetical protein TRIUR3_13621 [Triticum urartu]
MGKERDEDGETKDKKTRVSWTTAQLDLLVSMMKEYADAAKFHGQNVYGFDDGQLIIFSVFTLQKIPPH